MPGVLGHTIAGILAALIVYFRRPQLEYSLSIFIGNLLPDVLKFGVTALRQATWNVLRVQQDASYTALQQFLYTPSNWFTLGFFIFAILLLLYHYHIIKEKKMEEYDELYIYLLIGILMHLIMDAFLIENSPWI